MRISLLIISLIACQSAFSQFFNKNKWDDNRHQIEWGIGTANFLGDLGGKDDIGTNDLQDLEKTEFNLGAYIGYKYTVYKKLYARANFSFARLSGDDQLTLEEFRQNRNLHFRSNVFELAVMAEYEFPINFRKGHIYDIKGASGWKSGGSSFFVFAGIGAFYFNPKAQVNEEWVELKPLRTEGQGLPGGPDEYNRVSLAIPVGVSITKRFSQKLSLGLELTYRYTFTDYIDDVSTTYYSPYDIDLYNDQGTGELAAYLSNPSLGLEHGGLGNVVTAPGQQRGDQTDDDGYMLLTVRGQYLLTNVGGYRTGYRKVKFKKRVRGSKRIIF